MQTPESPWEQHQEERQPSRPIPRGSSHADRVFCLRHTEQMQNPDFSRHWLCAEKLQWSSVAAFEASNGFLWSGKPLRVGLSPAAVPSSSGGSATRPGAAFLPPQGLRLTAFGPLPTPGWARPPPHMMLRARGLEGTSGLWKQTLGRPHHENHRQRFYRCSDPGVHLSP